MINSINPRAFIKIPIPIASLPEIPVALAASVHATHFPSTAATKTAPHIPHKNHEFSNPIFVFNPE
jgi:hypothetical protein